MSTHGPTSRRADRWRNGSTHLMPKPTAAASSATAHCFAIRDAPEGTAPMRRFIARRSSRILQPACESRGKCEPRRPPALIEAQHPRQRQRAQVAQPKGQGYADDRKLQRRAGVAQRIKRRGIQPPRGRCQQAHRRARPAPPTRKSRPGAGNAPIDKWWPQPRRRARQTPPPTESQKTQSAGGHTAFAGEGRLAICSVVPSALDIAGSSAAETAMPNKLTGSVYSVCA